MDMINEKSRQTDALYDLFLVGKKVHEVIENCSDDFIGCETYISELNMLVIESASNLTDHLKTKFRQLAIKNKNFFFLFDQLNRKFGAQIFRVEVKSLTSAIFYEMEKVKSLLKKIDEIKKLEGQLYVISQAFI